MGKTAAITGAASGIGQAAVRRLLEAGWTVFGLDVAEDRLQAVAQAFFAYQDRFRPILCDVSDVDVLETFAEGVHCGGCQRGRRQLRWGNGLEPFCIEWPGEHVQHLDAAGP